MKFAEFVPVDHTRVSSKQLELVNATLDQNSPDIWRELAELYFVALRNAVALRGLKDELLVEVAIALVYQTIQGLGGNAVYLPKRTKLKEGKRDALINAEYRGNNLNSIAKKYDLTTVRVRQILNRKATPKRDSAPSQR